MPGISAGKAFVDIIPELSEFNQNVQSGVGKSLTGLGSKLTKTLTPVAGALAASFGLAFKAFDEGADTIVTLTGASGDKLKGLQNVMKEVAGNSKASFGEIGQAVGQLNRRLGLTGEPLKKITQQVADLKELGVAADTEQIAKTFQAWNVDTKNQSSALDKMFKASQLTGVGVDQISSALVSFRPQLQKLGFGLDDSVALLANFESKGLDSGKMMAGLAKGAATLAKEGKNPQKVFEALQQEVERTGLTAGVQAKVFKIFGARAGVQMADALKKGAFSVGNLGEELRNSEGAIADTRDGTRDLGDKLVLLKNKVIGVIGPVGEVGGALFGAVAAIGPALLGFGQLAPVIARVAPAIGSVTAAAAPWLILAAAIGVSVFLLVKYWDEFKAGLARIWGFIKGLFNSALQFIKNWGPVILAVLTGPLGLIILAFTKFRKQTMEIFTKVRDAIVGAFTWVRDRITGIIEGIGGAFKTAINFIIGLVEKGLNFLLAPLRKVGQFANKIPGLGRVVPDIPKISIPRLARGGDVLKGGLTAVGEAGVELLNLPKGAQVAPLDKLVVGGGGGPPIFVNVEGSVVTEKELERIVREAYLALKRRNVRVGLA